MASLKPARATWQDLVSETEGTRDPAQLIKCATSHESLSWIPSSQIQSSTALYRGSREGRGFLANQSNCRFRKIPNVSTGGLHACVHTCAHPHPHTPMPQLRAVIALAEDPGTHMAAQPPVSPVPDMTSSSVGQKHCIYMAYTYAHRENKRFFKKRM